MLEAFIVESKVGCFLHQDWSADPAAAAKLLRARVSLGKGLRSEWGRVIRFDGRDAEVVGGFGAYPDAVDPRSLLGVAGKGGAA